MRSAAAPWRSSTPAVAELMGRMGYRVLSPGNHAFDYNASENDPLYYIDTLIKTITDNSASPVDVVCINLSLDGQPLPGISPVPITVRENGDFRLVVVGVITPYTRSKSNRSGLAGFDFGLVEHAGRPDHATTKEALLDNLERTLAPFGRPGDVVVVLSHVGWDETEDYGHGQVSGRDLALVPNVDFVVDSHSHNLFPPQKIGAAYYGNAGRYLENLVEITITREGEDLHSGMEIKSYSQLKQQRADTDILSALRDVSDRMGLGEQLFYLDDGNAMGDAGMNQESTPLGRFLCRAMAEISGADLAVYNSGGIRAGLPVGWVTAGNIYDMIPFQNNLVSFSMTGREIEQFFADLPARNTNAFPQFFGMTAILWEDVDSGLLRLAGVADRDGRPIEGERLYSVAINSYMAFGGDDYSFPTGTQIADFGDCVVAIIAFLRKYGAGDLQSTQINDCLIIHPSREGAEKDWKERLAANKAA